MAPVMVCLTQALDMVGYTQSQLRLCWPIFFFLFCFSSPIRFVAAACMIHVEPLQIISVQFAPGWLMVCVCASVCEPASAVPWTSTAFRTIFSGWDFQFSCLFKHKQSSLVFVGSAQVAFANTVGHWSSGPFTPSQFPEWCFTMSDIKVERILFLEVALVQVTGAVLFFHYIKNCLSLFLFFLFMCNIDLDGAVRVAQSRCY